jgi:Fuc2NAc and GlcNAc transferase
MFNFMDGMDGLAAMEAIFVFGVGGYILWERSQSMMAASALVLAAAVAGFLVWNRPPARIFMGDAGSGFLGFMVGAFAVLSMVLYQVPILVWIILYAVFWYDATATLIRRILAKEKWYAAHRSHAYQRLHHLAKWSHARVLKHAIGLNLLLAALALIGYENPGLLPALLAIALILLTVVYGAIERIAPFRTQKTQAYITQDQG